MSPDTATSPSSPRKRQLGFVPMQEPSSAPFKVESMEHDGMDDLWAVLGGESEIRAPTEHMDYDDLIGNDDVLLPGMSMPSLTTSNQSESVSDVPAVPSSASTKTTPESSNPFIVSPAASQYDLSPVNKEGPLQLPVTGVHSTDSIAQMLEIMRACNSQDAPPPAPSSSSYSLSSHPDLQYDDQRGEQQQRSGRKKERSNSRSTRQRKQVSPAQKLSRSFSHGSENSQRPGMSSLQHRARQRSKTNAVPPRSIAEDFDGDDNKSLYIDTDSAIQAVGPSGLKRHASTSSHTKHRQPVSAGSELWQASESPTSAAAAAPPFWPMQSEASLSQQSSQQQKGNNEESLSLSEFLKRPEGAMWFQHFQKQYPSRAAQPDFAAAAAAPSYPAPPPPPQIQHQQQQPAIPSMAPLTPSISAYLPPPTDVASVLGMQQAPNQALVQAFQTAFVLGMQQLGMAGQFQPVAAAPPPAPAQMSQQYPFAWAMQQQAHLHHHQQQRQQLPSNVSPQHQQLPASTTPAESGDASAVLQSLLHDINQHRPDKQEFSVDEFLAFVANTVEGTGDDAAQQQRGSDNKEQEGKDRSPSSSRKLRKTAEGGSEASLPATAADKKKSGRSRRRTISISGQLSGTYLDDVAEDATEVKKSESQRYHHKSDKTTGTTLQPESLYHQSVVDDREEEYGDIQEGEDEDRGSDESERHREAPASTSTSQNSKLTQHEKEASKLAERRRRRRESHNAVERRRRDHINDRIAELASLLPESMLLDAIAASTSGGTMPHIDLSLFARPRQAVDPATALGLDVDSNEAAATATGGDIDREADALEPVHSSSETLALAQSKPNKGIILSKIVEYIKHLHEFCSVLRVKNSELIAELDRNKALISMEPALSYESNGEEDSTMVTATPPAHLMA